MRRQVFNLHVMLWPAEDIPGQWLAHCLELDLLTQGNSLAHAFEMLKDAAGIVLVSDLEQRLDPGRRRAPDVEWAAMWKRVREAQPVSLSELACGKAPAFAVVECGVSVTELTTDDLAAIAGGSLPRPVPTEFTAHVAFAPAAQVPARFRDVVRALKSFGVAVEPPRGGGSHWKATGANGVVYTIPAHNGDRTELADVYLRKTCNTFGIDYSEFRRRL